MALIRASAFFTTLLPCALAYSLATDLAAEPDLQRLQRMLSAFPNIGVTPLYHDRNPQPISETPYFMVKPSWAYHRATPSPDFVTNYPSIKLPGAALKGMGPKFPLTAPKVKLNFIGTSGMLPVTPPNKPELPMIAPKPAVANIRTKLGVTKYPDILKGVIDRVKLYKNIRHRLSKQDSSGHAEAKDKSGLSSAEIDYSTNPGSVNGGNIPERADHVPKSTSKLYPQKGRKLNSDLPMLHTVAYKPDQPLKVLKPTYFDYTPTRPHSGGENVAMKLPRVPSALTELQQAQLILLNTVANLPGGNRAVLDAARVD